MDAPSLYAPRNEPGCTGRFRHPLRFGAELSTAGVAFQFWAPAERAVALVIEGPGPERILPMRNEGGGWFTCSTAAPAGTLYRYQLENGQRVPDPASRFQPTDVHGASEVIDPGAFIWHHSNWRGRPWSEAVIYECHVGCFAPAGTFRAVQEKLDHLAALGVTALELMPVADFEGSRNWGYDGALLFAPDSSYGRPEDLKALVDAAHERGIMMILDVVYNHFGPSGNYLGSYAPAFFDASHNTPWGAAINFTGSDTVRQFFIDNACYWLNEYRFDGLRLDAVHAIHDASPRHIVTEIAAASTIPGRHIHIILENAANESRFLDGESGQACTAQWNDDFHHAAHVTATAEHHGYYIDFVNLPPSELAWCLAHGFLYQGQASAAWHGRARGEDASALSAMAFIHFLQNHDQIGNRADSARLAALIPEAPLRALTVITLLAPQIPMLFMGEEWASQRPFHFFCDFQGDLAKAVRDGRRKEFDHADVPGAMDPGAIETFESSKLDWPSPQDETKGRFFAFVRNLLDIRRDKVVPRLADIPKGPAHMEVRDNRALRITWSLSDGGMLTVAANVSENEVFDLGWVIDGSQIYASTDVSADACLDHLPGWTVCVRLTEAGA